MTFSNFIDFLVAYVWSLPCLLFILGVAIYITFISNFVQFRYFLKATHLIFQSQKQSDISSKSEELSPFQAFINNLGANIGNGSLAGIAVAICVGGPGSIVWLLVLATFSAALRYSEVFLGTYVIGKYKVGIAHGGPMVYMSFLPGGVIWSYVFTVFALCFMFVGGNLAQCHAVGHAIHKSLGISEFTTGFFILAFIGYIFLGGVERIINFLEKLVPFKVFLFLLTAIIILIYHYQSVPNSLYLMLYSALQPNAVLGGSFAFALQHALSSGFQQGIYASEAGLGTAAVAFASTKGKNSVENGLISMLGVFINIHVICFLVALCILSSGVWNCGETSSALIVSTYQTVFGKLGGWIVLMLVINFAMTVLVASAYNGKRCWDFLLQGKYSYLFPIIFSAASFCGTWMHVNLVWNINNLVNAILIMINIFGLLWSRSTIQKELKKYSKSHG